MAPLPPSESPPLASQPQSHEKLKLEKKKSLKSVAHAEEKKKQQNK